MVNSFQSANLAQPDSGSLSIALSVDLTASASVNLDLTQPMLNGKLDFIQSVYIDNADNSVVCDLIFHGGPIDYRVRALANQQGWFPVTAPVGATRLTVNSNAGAKITVFLSNFMMAYYENAPPQGTQVVPPLTNAPINVVPITIAGPNQLVAGVGGQSVKLFRGTFEVDGPTTLKFTDGNGGPVLYTAFLTTGGAVSFPVSGIPYFNTSLGNGLFVSTSANVNLYGGFSYVQS